MEFACFSYDENHEFRLDDSSIKYYYTPRIGADLSRGFNTFQKLDDSRDEHLDSLLKAIIAHEKETGKKIDAHVVTWRGMMTKIMAALFEQQDGSDVYASSSISHIKCYKFETLSTLPETWHETSREYIENRENQVVNNKEQYCSVVRTGISNTILCLGGEVDAST
ncbi:Protein rai1 [Claviceps sorghi]|nr:Protein rai1 [Claviceps sorghi]